jgi:hypothetical protein
MSEALSILVFCAFTFLLAFSFSKWGDVPVLPWSFETSLTRFGLLVMGGSSVTETLFSAMTYVLKLVIP